MGTAVSPMNSDHPMLSVNGLRKVLLESTPNARIELDGVDLTLSRGSFCGTSPSSRPFMHC